MPRFAQNRQGEEGEEEEKEGMCPWIDPWIGPGLCPCALDGGVANLHFRGLRHLRFHTCTTIATPPPKGKRT